MGAAWGDAPAGLAAAEVKLDVTYTTPREYNVPMEPHACVAAWEGDRLTVWEPSQWVGGARQVISEWMGLEIEKVRVVSPYVGGGFGSKIAPHPHVALACAATRELGRPVKVSLTRPQTFTGLGGRPRTHQRNCRSARAVTARSCPSSTRAGTRRPSTTRMSSPPPA
jgi:xanthine dehydrogenase YagR molybdenum-binding subunit